MSESLIFLIFSNIAPDFAVFVTGLSLEIKQSDKFCHS